jgi:hypothetical protein
MLAVAWDGLAHKWREDAGRHQTEQKRFFVIEPPGISAVWQSSKPAKHVAVDGSYRSEECQLTGIPFVRARQKQQGPLTFDTRNHIGPLECVVVLCRIEQRHKLKVIAYSSQTGTGRERNTDRQCAWR